MIDMDLLGFAMVFDELVDTRTTQPNLRVDHYFSLDKSHLLKELEVCAL